MATVGCVKGAWYIERRSPIQTSVHFHPHSHTMPKYNVRLVQYCKRLLERCFSSLPFVLSSHTRKRHDRTQPTPLQSPAHDHAHCHTPRLCHRRQDTIFLTALHPRAGLAAGNETVPHPDDKLKLTNVASKGGSEEATSSTLDATSMTNLLV